MRFLYIIIMKKIMRVANSLGAIENLLKGQLKYLQNFFDVVAVAPDGENIHGTGIVPDITVESPQEVLEVEYSRQIDPQFQKALEVIKEK